MTRQLLNTAYLILAGEVVIVAIIIFTIFVPTIRRISESRQELASVEQELSTRRQFLESIDRKRIELDQKQEDEKLLAIALPNKEDIEVVVRLLHRAGQAAGVTIRDVKSNTSQLAKSESTKKAQGEATTIPDFVDPLAVEVNLNGSYQQFRVFLEQIEKSPRLMDVTSINISKDGSQEDRVEVGLTINFYKQTI